MNKIKLFFITLIAVGLLIIPSYAALTIDWKVDTTSDIVNRDNMRDIAYNPVTGHLLLVECMGDTTQRGVWILDSNNGAILGRLPDPTDQPDGWGTGTQISPYGIAVDANGVIYVQRYFYTNNNEILRYASEAATPTIAATNDNTYIRSLNVVGTGINTKLVTICQSDSIVRIFGTTDGVTFSEEERFDATPAVHDAQPNSAMNIMYTARAFNGTAADNTHRWIKSAGTWSEDASFTKAQWIMTLALSEPTNTLYGAIWDMGQGVPAVTEGIRVWNATTGVQTDSLDIGESGSSSRGSFIAIDEKTQCDMDIPNPIITIGQTQQLTATVDLHRKLYFTICGLVGYGRINLSTVSGPVWASNNYSIASVSNTGLVSALTVGVCTVSASYTRDAEPFTANAVVSVIATSAPLAPDATSYNRIHRTVPVAEISAPRATRSWELFQ